MARRLLFGASIALAMAVLVACGSAVPGSSASAPTPLGAATGTGTLSVSLKDSPFNDAKALLVTISEVSVHASGGDWMTVPLAGGATSLTCDLKRLTNAQDVLGTTPLAAGHYTQIRLTVSSAVIYFETATSGATCAASFGTLAGASAPVDIPSGVIKLNHEFDVTAGGTTSILLDFDGDKSVNQIGNGTYKMSPVISIVSVQ